MALPAVMVALVWRRWWVASAAMAVVAGVWLGSIHQASVAASDLSEGGSREVTVRLTTAARPHTGTGGQWWSARGSVCGGAQRANVTVTGRGAPAAGMGDVLTARVAIGPPRSRGESATLRIVGQARVAHSTSPSAQVREALRAVAGDDDPGWLLSGMALGMDEGLSQDGFDDMRGSGLSHLTAVSGANCAVLVVLVHWLGGWLRLRPTVRTVGAGVVLAAFTVTVGPQPSVLRAVTMAGLTLVAGLVGGRRAAGHMLQVSAVGLLLIDPWLAYSVGFMLSIAATAGLIVLVDRGPLAATMAAQVATFPILLAIGGSVGLRTVLANVVVAPLAMVIPVVGLAAALLEWTLSWSAPLVGVGRRMCVLVLTVAGWEVPGQLHWLPGWPGVAVAAVVTAAVLILGRRRIVVVAFVLVGGVSWTAGAADPWPPANWWIVACDVGQGDGLVVRSAGRILVVDTGPDPEVMDSCLGRLGVDAIDLLIITHFHDDHVGGLPGVLRQRSVGQVWVSPCREPPDQFAAAWPALSGLPVSVPVPGTQVQVGDMVLSVIWPQRVIQAGSVPNNASVSFLLAGPQGRAVFLGDTEPEAHAAILRSADVRADVVKVPHHGSAQFLVALPGAVSARIALVGVGAGNTFGHPAAQTVHAWQQAGAAVYTTEDNGDIAITDERAVAVRGRSR